MIELGVVWASARSLTLKIGSCASSTWWQTLKRCLYCASCCAHTYCISPAVNCSTVSTCCWWTSSTVCIHITQYTVFPSTPTICIRSTQFVYTTLQSVYTVHSTHAADELALQSVYTVHSLYTQTCFCEKQKWAWQARRNLLLNILLREGVAVCECPVLYAYGF